MRTEKGVPELFEVHRSGTSRSISQARRYDREACRQGVLPLLGAGLGEDDAGVDDDGDDSVILTCRPPPFRWPLLYVCAECIHVVIPLRMLPGSLPISHVL